MQAKFVVWKTKIWSDCLGLSSKVNQENNKLNVLDIWFNDTDKLILVSWLDLL